MKQKPYSTREAWEGLETDAEKEHLRRMEKYFRKEFNSLKTDLIHFALENSDDKLADLLKQHKIFVYEDEPEYERPQNIFPSTKKGG